MSDRSRRALEAALERIRTDHELNAWSHLAIGEALEAAAESDMRLAAGTVRSPLEGRLIALKGNIAVRGWPYEGGLASRRGECAERDAALVSRLRAAGAVLLGQTRMDAGALGAEGRSIDGPIRNPHRPSHSVGGSSGGCAAALAAGHVELAVGTDTIGSVRIPASFCGVSSLKPSKDRIDLDGVLPVHPQFDHAGPMTTRASMLWPMMNVLTGMTPSAEGVTPNGPHRGFEGRVIGYVADASSLGATIDVLEHFDRGLERLRALGATLVPLALAPLDPIRTRRAVFSLCEHTMWKQHRHGLETMPERYAPALRAMLDYGGSLSDQKLAEFEQRVRQFAVAARSMMQPVSVLVMPTTPRQAFDYAGDTPTDLADLTVFATAAELPAVSVPLATGDALPVGLQIVTSAGQDELACELASIFERGP